MLQAATTRLAAMRTAASTLVVDPSALAVEPSALAVQTDLLPDDIVAEAGAQVVLETIGERDNHVLHAAVLDELREELAASGPSSSRRKSRTMSSVRSPEKSSIA